MSAEAQFQIEGKLLRIQFSGCDCLKLNELPKRGMLDALPMRSPIAFIRAREQGVEHLFYANKNTDQLIELPLPGDELETLLETPRTLTLDDILRLESLTHLNLSDAKHVKDISVKATERERMALLGRLHDSHATPKNSTYTYIFQTYLAKYQALSKQALDKPGANSETLLAIDHWMQQIHMLSAQFIDLEHLINRPGTQSPQLVIDALEQKIHTVYLTNVFSILEGYEQSTPQIKHTIEALKNDLEHHANQFCAQLKRMKSDNPTHDDISRLLSVQTRDSKIQSLGTFMAKQMMPILDCGIKVVYELSDNRVGDLFHLPDAIGAMSDAKAMVQLKAFSLDGAEYNETYAPIPQMMLNALQHDVSHEALSSPPRWFSLTPYIAQLNPEDLDKTICLVTDRNTRLNQSARLYYQLGLYQKSVIEALKQISLGLLAFIASGLELALFVPLRLFVTLALATLDLLGSIITPNFAHRWTNWLDHQISYLHELLSPVRAAKRLSNSRYRRMTDAGEAVKDDHQKLIEACQDDSSFFHTMFIYFNPERITRYTKDLFTSFVGVFENLYRNPLYLFSSPAYKATPEEVYQVVKLRYELTKAFQAQKKASVLKDSSDESYENVTYCPINEIATPLQVFREIMLTLDDTVIDPMFRKSPGAATFYFMISMTTFGTYVAPPAMIAWMKSVPAWLQIPTDILSIHFTGKSTALGPMEQMVACFLEWKLGFFSTELVMEIQRGNYDFLHEVIKEPEQITLGLIGLVGMGMALQYLPMLPTQIKLPSIPGMPDFPPIYNYYAEVINLFIKEARSCAAGTIGFTSVEYGFLGIKFAMLMHSMLSGALSHEKQAVFKQLAALCSDSQFIEEVMHACQDEKVFDEAQSNAREIKFNAIVDKALASRLNTSEKFLGEDIQAFKAVLSQVISKEAIKEYERLKDPVYSATAQNELHGDVSQETKFRSLVAENTPLKKSAFDKAQSDLLDAIKLTLDEKTPLIFDENPFKEANKFYDYLDGLFERYNAEAKKSGRTDLCIMKRPYLDVFYNKYCYQGSNNLLRSLLFIPVPIPVPPYYFPGVYLAVALFRGIKYLTAIWQNKPSVAHQVVKSFNKDLVLLMQVFSMFARTGNVMMRALGYLLRPFAILTLFALSLVPYLGHRLLGAVGLISEENIMRRKSWFKSLDEWGSNLTRFHRIKLWDIAPFHLLRVLYAKAARAAGSSADVKAAAGEVLSVLERDEVTARVQATEEQTQIWHKKPATVSVTNRYSFHNQVAPHSDDSDEHTDEVAPRPNQRDLRR